MTERELETVRFVRHGSTHFVRSVNEPWSGRGGKARTYCGRETDANNIEPRKFSAVRDWCLPCYWNRHKAIDREFGVDTGSSSRHRRAMNEGLRESPDGK